MIKGISVLTVSDVIKLDAGDLALLVVRRQRLLVRARLGH